MDKFVVYLGIATLCGYLILLMVRPGAAANGLEVTVEMFLQSAGWFIVSMFATGLLAQFIDHAVVAKLLGKQAGMRGIVIGALLGIFGTGSRWAVYPIAAGLLAAEASPGSVFAFMTSWQLISLPRVPAEFPFFGVRFTVVRAVASLCISMVGGLLVEWVETSR